MPSWFSVIVRPRREPRIAALLRLKGYDTFLPVYTPDPRSRPAALIPGYVFCHFESLHRMPVLTTPGVMGIVSVGRIPAPVEEWEIRQLMTLTQRGIPMQPQSYLEIGQKVRITQGPLRGLEGLILEFRGSWRLVLSITLLRRSVGVELERSDVVPVDRVRHRPAVEAAAGL